MWTPFFIRPVGLVLPVALLLAGPERWGASELAAVAAILTALTGLTAAIFAGVTALLRTWVELRDDETKRTLRAKNAEINALKKRVVSCEAPDERRPV